jgi:Protein of unknown function (DUF1631)
MSAPATATTAASLNDPSDAPPLRGEEARALLRSGFERFEAKLMELASAAVDTTDDLFETATAIPDGEVEAFRKDRDAWLKTFQDTLRGLFERRLGGHRRKGLRPDAEASLAALRVLTPFDHEKQAALTDAAGFLTRFTQRELAALDMRVGLLLEELAGRELDNPFAIPYVLDALGSSSRAVYPNPRVWRPLMERLLIDLTPNFNGLYIALNRLLADHGILPDIKATLRARSEHRPADDRDLLATFTQMLHDVESAVPDNIVVPELGGPPGAPPALNFGKTSVPATAPAGAPATAPAGGPAAAQAPMAPQMISADILAGLAALASLGAKAPAGDTSAMLPPAGGATLSGADTARFDQDFPSLDPLMALGTSTSLFATLAQWQKLDLRTAIARMAPPPAEGAAGPAAVVPLNLIPHIRAAVADQISNPADAISVDVIGLLFDYIFRDPTIAESTRALFGRLQVPIVKAALLDRSFFSDKQHPARKLLDHLAEAAVGATNDDTYRGAFERVAQKVVEKVCADFEIDVAVFSDADRELLAFADAERQVAATALSADVEKALHAEEDEADRAAVRVLLRDRLAGHDVPFEVRSFIETIWADYLAMLRREHGADSPQLNAAMVTLDDMLWSIGAKERTAQKARLTKMIPSLIGGLRAGCKAVQIPPDRSKAFFESLYQLHMKAIKQPEAVPGDAKLEPAGPVTVSPAMNVHDYVGEMPVGTWLQFDADDGVIDAKLNWVSPLRAKYLFTSRSRSHAFILSPEELAYKLGSNAARLVAEPVPLWDRAVSAALNTLAARKPPAASNASLPTPALA